MVQGPDLRQDCKGIGQRPSTAVILHPTGSHYVSFGGAGTVEPGFESKTCTT